MKASKNALDLIKKFEGLVLKAYKPLPSEKYYTIGWGHYGEDVKIGMKITQEEAEKLLRSDIAPIEKTLNGLNINLSQGKFDALVSWCFNLGLGNFKSSTMYRFIVSKKSDLEITDQMVKWHNAGGKPLLGLKRRRCEEANLFLGKDVYFVDSLGRIYKK